MPEERAISVSEAMTAAKRALEGLSFRVVGEVSEFSDKPGYKAAYFTIADDKACMSCMMWRDAYLASDVQLRTGVLVELVGTFSAYVPKGRMQFMVKSLSLAGEGMLRIQVAALARKLELEGLMRADRKRPLPSYPDRVAVVTSPRGKAIHDVIRTLRRRYPIAELLVAGVAVEGAMAPEAIVEGLRAAQDARPDVILLVRGGGSYEDLMPFNDEAVARAVADSVVPVVTGIGHEPDVSIADMVADARASTPTAAAEMAAPSIEEMSAQVDKGRRLLAGALASRLQHATHRFRLVCSSRVFMDSRVILAAWSQRLDGASAGLYRALPAWIDREVQRLTYLRQRLVRVGPHIVDRAEERAGRLASRLEDLSPLAILGRGYAVCFAADERTVVTSPSQVVAGDRVAVRVSQGTLSCLVESTGMEE